jgi:hypothetical protein
MLRKQIILLLFLVTTSWSFSQELITTSGDFYIQGNTSLSWSIGEPVSETFSSTATIFTQGFHQNYEDFVELIPISVSPSFDVYPNPFTQAITIDFNDVSQAIRITIADQQGKINYTEHVSSFSFSKQLSLNDLATGIYFLSFQSEDGTITVTKRIMKTKF